MSDKSLKLISNKRRYWHGFESIIIYLFQYIIPLYRIVCHSILQSIYQYLDCTICCPSIRPKVSYVEPTFKLLYECIHQGEKQEKFLIFQLLIEFTKQRHTLLQFSIQDGLSVHVLTSDGNRTITFQLVRKSGFEQEKEFVERPHRAVRKGSFKLV